MKKTLFIIVAILALVFFEGGYVGNGNTMLQAISKQQAIMVKEIVDSQIANKKKEVIWQEYFKAKQDLHLISDSKDVIAIVSKTLKTAEFARILGRADILSWQYNNIAKEIINEYDRTPITQRQGLYNLLEYGKKFAELAQSVEAKLSGNEEKKDIINRNLKCITKYVNLTKPVETKSVK